MLRRFRLEEPETVHQASELLGQFGDSAKIYAGGTELLLAMKEGLVQYERLINVKNVKGLNEITERDGRVCIGALCTHRELETSELVRQKADLASTLLASVSHDLRTPLTAVRVAVENLRGDIVIIPEQRKQQVLGSDDF